VKHCPKRDGPSTGKEKALLSFPHFPITWEGKALGEGGKTFPKELSKSLLAQGKGGAILTSSKEKPTKLESICKGGRDLQKKGRNYSRGNRQGDIPKNHGEARRGAGFRSSSMWGPRGGGLRGGGVYPRFPSERVPLRIKSQQTNEKRYKSLESPQFEKILQGREGTPKKKKRGGIKYYHEA